MDLNLFVFKIIRGRSIYMHLVKKFLILVIVLLAFFIIYNLLKSRQTIKINYIKEMKEGFGESTGVSMTPLPEKYLSLPIREFIVKSSYNSAINDRNFATKEQIRHVLERGCRLIDFEIYTRNNIEFVSYSEDTQYQSMDTENEESSRLTLGDAFNTVVGYAFTAPSPSPMDPLFVSLRIKDNETETYSRIANLIDYAFKNKLYKGSVTSKTKLEELMGKVIIVLDTTSSSKYKSLVRCPESSPCFSNYVNIEAGSIHLPLYTYGNLETLPQKPVMTSNKLETDIKTFMMITPAQMDQLNSPSPANIIAKVYPQFLLYKFYKPGKELQEYEDIFNSNQTALVPVSLIVGQDRAENAAKP
jgi:hypothetical protein